MAACGGDSDGGDSGSDEDGEDAPAAAPASPPVELTGTIDQIGGDATITYTIEAPAGFEITDAGGITPNISDPNAEFGERDTVIEMLFLPAPNDAAMLIQNTMDVNDSITVIDQADEADLAWYTSTTPSSSNPDEIAFGVAATSRTLADGTALECNARTQRGIDEEWSADEAAAVADGMLAICRTLTAAP